MDPAMNSSPFRIDVGQNAVKCFSGNCKKMDGMDPMDLMDAMGEISTRSAMLDSG